MQKNPQMDHETVQLINERFVTFHSRCNAGDLSTAAVQRIAEIDSLAMFPAYSIDRIILDSTKTNVTREAPQGVARSISMPREVGLQTWRGFPFQPIFYCMFTQLIHLARFSARHCGLLLYFQFYSKTTTDSWLFWLVYKFWYKMRNGFQCKLLQSVQFSSTVGRDLTFCCAKYVACYIKAWTKKRNWKKIIDVRSISLRDCMADDESN